jgi:short-subunit dehydrogenase
LKSIAIFGAGPALGKAVARRYLHGGYNVVVVGRRPDKLQLIVEELRETGGSVTAVTADLANVEGLPRLVDQIRATVGEPDALYWGAAPDAFIPAVELTVRKVEELMPLGVYAPLSLIRAFLPDMLKRNEGAILTAQGASAVRGMPYLAGGLVLAAQRNYLESLRDAIAYANVFVGGLYIGAVIEGSAFHDARSAARAEGRHVPEMPTVDPAVLADLLWDMHHKKGPTELSYPSTRS